MLFRSKKDSVLPFPTSVINAGNEDLTSAFLIFHEINTTKYLTDVQKKLLNDEPIPDDILDSIKHELACKFIAAYTLFEPDRLSNCAVIDFEKDEISFDLSKSDIPIMTASLDKISKNVSIIGELICTHYSREAGVFFKNKSDWEIKIYKLLFALIARKEADKIPNLRNNLFAYLKRYCDQPLSKNGICVAISLKMMRNAMLENLGTMSGFYSECATINKDVFNGFFNLEIKDELDLLFVYYAYVRRAVPGNDTLNLRDYIAYAANYMITQSIHDINGSPDRCTIFHNIAKLNSPSQVLRIQECRNKLNEYHKETEFLYDLIFNNYRLIGQDRENAVNDYLNFINYVLSSYKRVERYNITDFIEKDESEYYAFLSDSYSELILIQNIIPCKEDFNSFVQKFTKDYDNFELRFLNVNSEILRLHYWFANYFHAQTYEELYIRLQLNTPKGINKLHEDTIETVNNAVKTLYDETVGYLKPRECSMIAGYPIVEAIKHSIITNYNDITLTEDMTRDDIKNACQKVAESIFIRLFYTIIVNHDICIALKGVKEGMCPVLMLDRRINVSKTITVSDGHAYVKLLYNNEICTLDPNVEFNYTENKDMSIYNIDHPSYEHATELNSTQIMLFGSGKRKNKIILIVAFAVIAIIGIVVVITFGCKEPFTSNTNQHSQHQLSTTMHTTHK